jgi:SPX domain protein involved in polyphosphate accumulation
MKYQKEISKSFIKVWEDFYINYLTMFKILEPEHEKYKERKRKESKKSFNQ